MRIDRHQIPLCLHYEYDRQVRKGEKELVSVDYVYEAEGRREVLREADSRTMRVQKQHELDTPSDSLLLLLKADRRATLVQSVPAKLLYKRPRYEKHKYRGKIKIRDEESKEKEGEI